MPLKKHGPTEMPPPPDNSETKAMRVARMGTIASTRREHRVSQVRLAAALHESGLTYVSTSRLTRAETDEAYAVRMCTSQFYLTAMRLLQGMEKRPRVSGR